MRVERRAVAERRILSLNGTTTDVAIIKSVMYYPDNDATREKYLHWHRMLESDHGLSERIDLGRSVDQDHLAERTRSATVAGAVLACYYLLDRIKDRGGVFAKPSLEKAMHAVEVFAHQADTFDDGCFIHASTRTLKTCWRDYRSCAPLWAAMWLNQRGSAFAFMEPNAQFDNAANVELFLGVAKGLRGFGTRTITIRQRPVLDDHDTWLIPERIVERTLPAARMHDGRLIAIMATYKSRKTEYVSSLVAK